MFNCSEGTKLKGLGHVEVGVGPLGAGLGVMHGVNLTADGQGLLPGHRGAAGLAQVGQGGAVRAEVGAAAAEHDGRVRPVLADLSDPFVLDVVQGDGVGDLVAEQKDVGLMIGQ